ncbi:hypothetical protein B0T19DRAFT_149648 [Cercophora scortea]|uniref:Uncharacterized protein n=1 Tax=Cercophora scortea TaxID=314031 RepID=A0AAE0IKZ5_9PEZI|nr:hypothetical protein B0T19DRAFT_149648 [Cercophora scortea]
MKAILLLLMTALPTVLTFAVPGPPTSTPTQAQAHTTSLPRCSLPSPAAVVAEQINKQEPQAEQGETSPTPTTPTAPTTLSPPSRPPAIVIQPTPSPSQPRSRPRPHIMDLRDVPDTTSAAPPSPPAVITPAPGSEAGNGIDANGNVVHFVQTTYYTCLSRGTSSHCGWHIPILDASNGGSRLVGGVAVRATSVAWIVCGLVLWWR